MIKFLEDKSAVLVDSKGGEITLKSVSNAAKKAINIPITLSDTTLKDADGITYYVKSAELEMLTEPKVGRSIAIIKSFRSEQGAKDWVRILGASKYPEAKVVLKDYYGDDDCYASDGVDMSMPVQVIVEKPLTEVIEAVSAADMDELVDVMIEKGLVEVTEFGPSISSKLYDMIGQWTKAKWESLIEKSVDESTLFGQLATHFKAMTQDQANANTAEKVSIPDGENNRIMDEERPAQATGDATGGHDSAPARTTHEASQGDPAPKRALTQAQADNKDGSEEVIKKSAAPDTYQWKNGKKVAVPAKKKNEQVHYFKSYPEAASFSGKNPGSYVAANSGQELLDNPKMKFRVSYKK